MGSAVNQGKEGYLSQKQILAIKAAIRLGCTLQKDHPLLIDDYRRGKYIREIVEEKKIETKYKVNFDTARTAVYYSFHGYSGNLFASYPGLAEESELEALCLRNKERNGTEVGNSGVGLIALTGQERKDVGERSRKTNEMNGTGIYGISTKRRKSIGKKTARKHKKNGTGFYSYDKEEQARKGRVSAERKGLKLFSLEEKAYLMALYDYPQEFRYQTTNQKGKLAWPRIVQEINEVFHDGNMVRNDKTLMKYLYKAVN